MAYIVSFFLLAGLFYILHYFTELTRMHKISITTALFITIYSAIAYNTYQNNQSQKLLNIVTKYKQGKTIKCNDRDVNATTYSLSIGTYTFIGKKNTPHYAEMIHATDCE
ncbi:hypothetical protein MNB_SM-5-1180 [hydrothermal vent metagenome]|uniref:Uncharacterized protein n=1 Tax=hydrothermal vent metagenome TaxID=652676 RepID=A0A1W1CGB8_9ZZZZ